MRGGRAAYFAEAAEWTRRVAFEAAHPGARFYRVGRYQQVYIESGRASITLTRSTLGELLDALDKMFGPPVRGVPRH